MKRIIIVFLFIICGLSSYSQVIKGTISDKKTKEKIVFAAVYFNGSFVGTNSDKNGYFTLDITGNSNKPLTISALGYYSVTLTDLQQGKPLIIYLTPKVFELKEVVINAKAREKNLKMFKDNFLGTSDNAVRCEIVNEKDITITFENDTLRAYASKPIQIINRGLGYKETYYLDAFWFHTKRNAFFISGDMVFNEDMSSDKSKKEFYRMNREQTYRGSKMHFFRALWNNELASEGFSLKNIGEGDLLYSNIVVQPDSIKKFMKFKGMLGIRDNAKMTTSWVSFLREFVYFDQKGYFDPFAISWDGAMAKQRVGDILPYEYSIK
ncbi:MAG: carboxypeptidase-like regulatory domain-containing protein [Bacteroidetes bacterium]|nr:carboxypeptidase-like regulatory domain-containing protein [Bacteroidota bacterium]